MQYQIIKNEYINQYGDCTDTYYTIKYKTKFLFLWETWKYVKHSTCSNGDCYNIITCFDSLTQAESFAKKHLCENQIYDGTKSTIVQSNKC